MMKHHDSRALVWLRLLLSVLCFLASLLTVVRAPTTWLWQVSVLVTEWGHVLALVSLLLLLPNWSYDWRHRLASGLCFIAVILSLTPLFRAISLADTLPAKLDTTFGPVQPYSTAEAPARRAPLILDDLVSRVRVPPLSYQTLVYTTSGDQELSLDLYYPPRNQEPAAVVVVIHGGYWREGNSQQLPALNTYLAERGYAIAAINYRLMPEWRFPAQRNDVTTAIRYLKDNARLLHIDPHRIALLGRSAGGHLALLTAYMQKDADIRGVVSFYAPTDLRWSYTHPGNPLVIDTFGVLGEFLGGNLEEVPNNYDAASPMRFVGPRSPPTLLIHGAMDELIFLRQSERLADLLQVYKIPHFLLAMPWATHGCDYNFNGPCGQISTYAIEHFLAAVMEKKP